MSLSMTSRELLRRLSSPRLALWLIGVLMGMSLLSVVVPQHTYLGSQYDVFATRYPALAATFRVLGLDDIFGGWIMIAVVGLLFVNTAACTLRRFTARRQPPRLSISASAQSREISTGDAGDAAVSSAASLLSERGWQTTVEGDGVLARRGASGFWGSMLLHVGLLVVIVGGVATTLTSFSGSMVLAEGQMVVDEAASYLTIGKEPVLGEAFTGATIALDGTRAEYEDGVLVGVVASMRGIGSSGQVVTEDVRVNYPFEIDGKSYLIQNSGYAATIRLAGEGQDPTPLSVNLATETERGWTDRVAIGQIEGGDAYLVLTATPVPLGPSELVPQERLRLDDPRLEVELYIGERPQWSVTLAEGETATPPAGPSVTFEGLGLWDQFQVRSEPGRWVAYIGFWMIVAGAAWRFLVPERRIIIAFSSSKDGRWRLRGSLKSRPWAGLSSKADIELLEALLGPADEPPADGDPREGRETG